MTLDQIEGLKVRLQAPPPVLKLAALWPLRWRSGLTLRILLHQEGLQDLIEMLGALQDPTIQCWTTEEEDDGDPPRLWAPDAMYPGTAFTRSLGDAGDALAASLADPAATPEHGSCSALKMLHRGAGDRLSPCWPQKRPYA